MPEQRESHEGGTSGFSGAGNEELFRQVQEDLPETETPSPERQRPSHESLTVTYLNTSFSELFDHPQGLDELLVRDERPRENAIFGFSEVVQSKRADARRELEERGYNVIAPPEDSQLDLIWAVSPEIQIEASDAYAFSRKGIRRIASRRSSKGRRHVGVEDLTAVTPQGNKVRLGQTRLSPWVIEPVRRKQLEDMTEVLGAEFSPGPDDEVLLTVFGGDMNHVKPLRGPDDEIWAALGEEGWQAVLEPGTPTHYSGEKYKTSSRVFRALGRKSEETQLDAAYARPREGVELVDVRASPDTPLTADQIGYVTDVIEVEGTDHRAVQTRFTLPIAGQPGLT